MKLFKLMASVCAVSAAFMLAMILRLQAPMTNPLHPMIAPSKMA